ncbi:hypothetical protein PN36_10760 [Candidatus Thiomargarita nelsonii]|uniref:OsmC family protein n=1 Tax=Candidatus Thiomargarita nelsonii TaxID=1003181 RepID=A0A0A6RRI0_9GAMM|nr:hypothetical protein PN36_10760 [Candidatus Thiomargarita nelsonii]
MDNRTFHLRLKCTYQGTNNLVDELTVEVLKDKNWETLELSVRSPGFLLFINALFSCQHLYMRTNSAERSLILSSALGELYLETDEFWEIKDVIISFNVNLKSGKPSEDDISYITERMTHCPVSSNLPKHIQIKNSVHFV